ncbi:PDZ domain-containing protein [Marinitoga lauensis]|uniref:PDZ domain-containing protein n=1 Tax=Marinitoga lauensis TaxID=2201189 RepID=UPI001010D0F1|nr:PDZ domain-containing protein [Marinitoga lauensis]
MGKTKFVLNILIVAVIFYLIWINTEYKLKINKINIFGKMYNYIKNNYYKDLTDEEIDDMIYNAITGLHTKYSDFINSNENYVELSSEHIYKLGFTGKYNFKKQAIEIKEVFFGSKVYKEGLRSGDYIIAINGKDVRRDDLPEFENTENFTITVLNKNRETFEISFSKRPGFYKMIDTKVIKENDKKL